LKGILYSPEIEFHHQNINNMIIGMRSKVLAKVPLNNNTCNRCEKRFVLELVVLQDYAHFFFIPFIPAGKSGAIRCTNCGLEISNHDLSPADELTYKELKKETTTPIWTFSFVCVLLCLLVIPLLLVKNKPYVESKLEGMIRRPKVGDVYQVKWEEQYYSWFKIDSLSQDSVWLLTNSTSTPIKAGLSAIREEPYDSLPMILNRNDLKLLYVEHQVIDISRNKDTLVKH